MGLHEAHRKQECQTVQNNGEIPGQSKLRPCLDREFDFLFILLLPLTKGIHMPEDGLFSG